MIIVTSHTNTDFDALASMVAAAFLYPGALRVLPSQVTPQVRNFLSVHWDLLQLKARKDTDLQDLRQLVVTDTSSWERLDTMMEFASRSDIQTVVWDHHPPPGSIVPSELHREEVGATVTLLLERIQAMDCAVSPMHATLFLLGIYDDTGSLSFPSTTARDAYMAGFMLESGADLHVVSAYLDSSLDTRHLDLFSRMLDSSEVVSWGGLQLGLCLQNADKGLSMLPAVVDRYQEIKGLDAALGIFPMGPEKSLVIGRSKTREFDVGALMRQLGGGGHPGAGSTIVKATVQGLRRRILETIQSMDVQETKVRSLISPVTERLSPDDRLLEARAVFKRTGSQALLVVDASGRLLGSLGFHQLAKIRRDRQWEQPVTSMMRREVIAAHPEQSLREALEMMSQSEIGYLPVLERGLLLGQITRSTIILNMYDF